MLFHGTFSPTSDPPQDAILWSLAQPCLSPLFSRLKTFLPLKSAKISSTVFTFYNTPNICCLKHMDSFLSQECGWGGLCLSKPFPPVVTVGTLWAPVSPTQLFRPRAGGLRVSPPSWDLLVHQAHLPPAGASSLWRGSGLSQLRTLAWVSQLRGEAPPSSSASPGGATSPTAFPRQLSQWAFQISLLLFPISSKSDVKVLRIAIMLNFLYLPAVIFCFVLSCWHLKNHSITLLSYLRKVYNNTLQKTFFFYFLNLVPFSACILLKTAFIDILVCHFGVPSIAVLFLYMSWPHLISSSPLWKS